MPFQIFKKRKEKEEKIDKEKKGIDKEEKVRKKSAEKKAESTKTLQKEQPSTKGEKIAWRIIKGPHITEKSAILAEQNQYVFKVYPNANKIDIKRAIKEIYGVDVEKVRIINVPPKKRRRGMIEGERPGYKKAIVTIKKGQKIEILPK